MTTTARWAGLLVGVFAFVLAACEIGRTPAPAATQESGAAETLSSFLDMLAQGEYARAAGLYAGSLDSMQGWSPELDPGDPVALMEYGCDFRLLQCLPVRSIEPAGSTPEGDLIFHVEFSLPDGTLFVLGPCCGATETEMPPMSTFDFRVRRQPNGEFAVLDLPPYVP